MYKDLKVTSGEVAANNVKSAPDRLQGTATENKNVFDKLVELFVGKYNDLLDELDDNEIKAIDPITISGYTISHANSGVTQGMYGTDQEQDPQHGEKFIVPYFITDEHGHIVSAGNSEVQLPSGGGGGGTDNYNDLSNKPSINSVTLSGNKSASDLSLASASHSHTKSDISDFPSLATVATTGDYDDLSDKPSIPSKTSDLTNDSGFINTETDPVFTSSVAHGITSSDISNWNGKSDFSGDYDDLTNKPTIPSKTSDLTNDSGYIAGETDPVFTASAAHGITNSDISGWNNKSDFSGDYDDLTNKPTIPSKTSDLANDSGYSSVSFTRYTTSGTNIADIEIDGTTTKIYAPTSGGGGVTDYDQLTSRPQVNSVTLTGNKSSSDLGVADEVHTHTKSDITDFPTIPSKTSDLTNDSGFLSAETDPVFSASAASGITSSDISTWNGKSDFSGSYNDLTNKPTIPANTSDLNNDSGFISADSSGNVSLSGSITTEGHDSPIGYRPTRQTGSYSLATGTSWVTVPSSGLARTTLSQGTWIIQAQAIFASNSTGWRGLRIYDVTTSESIGRSGVTQPAVNGATTNLTTMAIIALTTDNEFTLQVVQNSGNPRNVDLQFHAVRIA